LLEDLQYIPYKQPLEGDFRLKAAFLGGF